MIRPTRPEGRDIRLAATALLARRDFATGELARRLESQGYDTQAVAGLVCELTESGSLDDGRYAHNYVAYHAGRGQGPVRIGADLRALGVATDLIDAALAAGPDWRALAAEQRRRRFGAETPVGWAQKARQARFLQYRGFSSDHIRLALGADFDSD